MGLHGVLLGLLVAVVVGGTPRVSAGGSPSLLWRHSAPGWGEPAWDGSSIYVLTRAHELVALDSATGSLRWQAPTGGPGDAPWGSAIKLTGSLVIVGDDALVAFDRASGRQVWRFVPPDGPGVGPYLGDTRSGLVMAGSNTGWVYAIAAESGRLRWSRRVASVTPTVVFPPVLAGRSIVVAFTSLGGSLAGGLTAFDARGRTMWRRDFAPGFAAAGPPIVADGTVVVARTDGRIDVVSLATGRRLWSLPRLRSRDPRQPLVRDARALGHSRSRLVAASLTGEIVAYDVVSRRPCWRYDDGPDGAAPLRIRVDATTVYAPFTDGSLIAIDLRTGRERWRTDPRETPFSWPPASTADSIVAAGADAIVALSSKEAR